MKETALLEKVHRKYRSVTETLIASGMTAACMESCSSGLIASLLTDTPGASSVFKGGICAYSNEVKIAFGVPAEVIGNYGVYSLETAAAMACCVKEKLGTDIAAGVTGSLGSVDTANADSIPGEVFLAVLGKTAERSGKILVDPALSRFEAKLVTAMEAARMMEDVIREEKGKRLS